MEHWPDIVRRHKGLVWQTVYRLVPHDADAADCFQETFVSAWQIAQKQTVKNWPGLLHRLATTRALDPLRKRRRERRSPQGDFDAASDQPGPARQAESAELADRLAAALAELPAQQGVVYSLRHLSGMSYQQIAEELDITVNAVGVSLHKATERLREILSSIEGVL